MNLDSDHPERFQPGEWLRGEGPESDIAVCTRVRLARNVQGYSFSTCMGETESLELTAHVGDRLHAKATLFFARLGDANEALQGQRLFHPNHLRHWLSLVGIFEVGVHQDGTPMKEKDYPLTECATDPA